MKVWDVARAGDTTKLVELLAQKPHKLNKHRRDGRTLMHVAAEHGHTTMIRRLVSMGASTLDAFDDFKSTPLALAARFGHDEVIELLVHLGSKVIDVPNKQTWTPMYSAAYAGHSKIIETLFRLGSRAIDAPNSFGNTPMHAAVMFARESAIEMLVRLGSKVMDMRNNDGDAPIVMITNRASTFRLLWSLGCSKIPKSILRALGPYEEDEVAETRYRVYFQQTLVYQCLLELSRSDHMREPTTTRRIVSFDQPKELILNGRFALRKPSEGKKRK